MGRIRSAVVLVTTAASVIAVSAALRVVPASAAPPDPDVGALVHFLDDPSGSLQSWSQGLGTVGKLADALPAVATSPGSALGFGDLLDAAFHAGSTRLADAVHQADLNIDEPISIAGGRTGTLVTHLTTAGNDTKLSVDLQISRTLLDQPLSVSLPIGTGSNAPQSAFSSTGGVRLTVQAALSFDLVYDGASSTVYLVVDNAGATPTPALTVDAAATFGDKAAAKASIGILGVSLADDASTDLTLAAHFAATVSDPNNDGRLAFENPDHTPGELARAGSLAGLVSVGFAPAAGSLHADLHLQAAATSIAQLPAVDATITVDWPDISTGTPSVTATGLPSVGDFLNMTPRDLAVGIAQLVTSLTSIQRVRSKTDPGFGNLDLPFLKGSLADAIQLNETLKTFLSDWTYPGPSDPNFVQGVDDPAKAGEPKFVSLQGFLDHLDAVLATTGGGVSNVGFDAATHKLAFTLALAHDAPAHPVSLDAAAAASSGPATPGGASPDATYSGTGLTDSHQNWKPGEFVGRHVVAGSSGGTIASNTATTLTLDSNGWSPSVPNTNDPYTISGASGDVGVVALGNSLQSPDADASKPGHGIANANAVNATANVSPSYQASITLVLDLSPPVVHDPPLEQHNPDGSTVLVGSTPTGADRVLLRTSNSTLFTADFPIDAGIDIFANAGFLQTRLTGELHVCQKDQPADCSGSPPSGAHMLEVDLKDNGDITFGTLVSMLLNTPKQLLDVKVGVRATGSVTASVPAAANFFPGGSPTVGFHWNDLTQTSGTDGPQFDVAALSDLAKVDFDPANPRALFSIVLKTLQTLDTVIGSQAPTGAAHDVFATKIPVLGRSLGDLLKSDESGIGPEVTYGPNTLTDASRADQGGHAAPNAFTQGIVGRTVVVGGQVGIVQSFTHDTLTMVSNWATRPADGTAYTARSELDDVISILQNSPSDNMQALITLLNERLGHSVPITFAYADDASVGNKPSLVIKLDWQRHFHTSAPVQFDFNLPIGDQKLAGVQGSGSIAVGASGDITLGLVVPLQAGTGPDDAAALTILDDSSINLQVDASVSDGTLATTIGPLSLSLGDPTGPDKATADASYSIGLGKSGATGKAESFTQFLADVGPTVNQTSRSVDCGLAPTTDLSLCARLPLYASTDGGTTYSKLITTAGHSNDFTLRLPKQPQGGAPVTDVIDLAGAPIDGHPRVETPDPADLAAAISSHLIDLTRIDGIDSFMNLLQQSLTTASFGGKLPLVGEDLQQGADFIGKLKKTIDDALGNLAGVNSISGLRDWVNTKLAQGLQDAGLNPDLVRVDTQCSTRLDSAGAPTVELVNAGDAASGSYGYAIVSYVKDSSDQKHDAKPSPTTTISNGPTGLSASTPLKVSWTAVDNAAGYKVYRDDGSGLKLVADVTGTTFTDDGTATPGDAPSNTAGPNPFLTDCAFSDFDSVLIRLDVSQGDFSGDNLSCDGLSDPHKCIEKTVPLDIGIPGLSLRAATPGDGPKVQLGWRLHLAFGISRSDGFFVDTKDGDPQPEFAVGLNFTLPSAVQAQLAFINVTASNCLKSDTADCDSSAPVSAQPLFGGSFKIDIVSPHADGRLTLSDLSNASLDSLFDVKLNAGVHIDWLLKATAAGDLGAGFPGIQAELQLDWSWHNAAPGSDSSTGGNTPLKIAFQKVQINVGQVLGQVIGPIIKEIKKVTQPLDPVIKTLYAPIPVLSDLSHLVGGDDVTLVSIAKAFSTIAGGPDLTFVDRVLQIVKIVNDLPTGGDVLIPIGSFTLAGGTALQNTATPDNTASLIDTTTLDSNAGDGSGVLDDLDSHTTGGTPILTGSGGDPAPSAKAGFSFPVFEHPSSLFNLLLGGDVDLVKFDSGPLTLGFDWRQEFGPVYAPPPVLITLHGSASVTMHIVAGFDTYGIRKAFEAVRAGTFTAGTVGEAILQSLFFYTTDDKGKPLPVVSFSGELAAGAEVSAVLITVGVEGGVGLTVSFLWNDPNHDGKFRISEFLAAALNNPICLFSVSGRVYVFLKLFVKIGVGPFSVSFSFTIVNVTLLDFSATPNCQPPPPKLAGLSPDGSTLVVYAGRYGHAAQRGNSAWDNGSQDNETVKITSLHDYTDPAHPTFSGVAVDMLGIRRSFLNPAITRVVVDGRGYTKPMNVTFVGDGKQDTSGTGGAPPTAQFDRDAIVFGGSGDDNVKTGVGNSWIDGGAGNDTIVTGDRTVLNAAETGYVPNGAKAVVAGGPGDDSITVGNGDDVVSGDSSLGAPPTTTLALTDLKNDGRDSGNPLASGEGETGASVAVPDWAALPNPSGAEAGTDGNDTVSAGLGATILDGNGGRDTLSIGPDNALLAAHPTSTLFRSAGATLVGGTGDDTISGGSGDDTVVTGPDKGGLVADPDASGGTDDGSVNVVDTGTGNDTVYGSTGVDRVSGHSTPSQHDDIRGGAGADILLGGYGTDSVFGGPDDDYVIAEPSTVDLGSGPPPSDGGFGPLYTVTHTPLPDGVTPSAKTLVGGTGNDHIVGGDGASAIDGDTYNPTARCGPGDPVASDPVDESGNTAQDGNDKIIGGAGPDNVRAGGGNDLALAAGGSDLVCGESGNDALHGDDAADQLWGGTGADAVFGDAGADQVFGNPGPDALYGGDQNDLVEGNDGSDYASGGAGDDELIGGTRHAGRADQGDTLSGDLGDDTVIGDNGTLVGTTWTPLDLSGADPGAGGADVIFGGDGNDLAFGGLSGDLVLGGDGNDHLEGNNADDTIDGQAGEDELVGGGSQSPSDGVGYPDGSDTVDGGPGPDVVTGDNATVASPQSGDSTETVRGRDFGAVHTITLLDLGYAPAPGTSAGDVLHGGDGTDVVYGQGGDDTVTGDANDDYAEGGPGADTINGGLGEDDLVGGSSTPFADGVGQPDTGDTVHGDAAADVVIGDNGEVLRDGARSALTDRSGMVAQRRIVLYDLGPSPKPGSSGADVVTGDDGTDVVLGQGGTDRLQGNAGDDYVEGGQGSDWVEGDAGDDDLVGGSSTPSAPGEGQPDTSDAVFGGPGDDAVVGDNASLLRIGDRTPTFDRVSGTSGVLITARNLTLYDLTAPAPEQFGDDRLSGGAGVDVMYGQDGADQISGGPDSDYVEGNAGADIVRGDRRLDQSPTTAGEAATSALPDIWPGTASGFDDLEGAGPDGQDDLIGGSSLAAFRDTGDSIEGDGGSDFELGDNGVLRRVVEGTPGNLSEQVFTQRYDENAPLPAGATLVRVGDPGVIANGSTRFCSNAQATCEPAAASGDDVMFGDGGDDTVWGQDGNDQLHGGTGNDDMYGELGNDTMWGDNGADAMLGDRGGIVDKLINPSDAGTSFTVSSGGVPKETYTAFRQGTLDHRVDLLHDVNGDGFVGSSTAAPMPHAGLIEGGNDRLRGGNGPDDIHAGFGDDLANGDSGGDAVFGDDGADVLWGGKGCDRAVDTAASSPDCYVNGTFVPSARGTGDRMVDHVYGGAGGTSAVSLGKKGDVGADVIDWLPRGSDTAGSGCTSDPFPADTPSGTVDPCAWFEMTATDDTNPANDQHHQGTDWMYGGWDRDVMQADVSQNGPNPGDRQIDWNGSYNLYSVCNSANGGYNDVRQHSPAMQTFLQGVSFADGAGQDRADTATPGTSGFVELALAYPGADNAHAAGSAFPTTPGHFDQNACAGG